MTRGLAGGTLLVHKREPDPMRTQNEVTVLRSDLAKAILAGDSDAGEIFIYRRGGALVFQTPGLSVAVDFEGAWETPVRVTAAKLRALAPKLPLEDRVVMIYAAARLYVGSTGMPARSAATEVATDTEAPGQGLLPGIAPVTDRDRIEMMAKAPVRGRRR